METEQTKKCGNCGLAQTGEFHEDGLCETADRIIQDNWSRKEGGARMNWSKFALMEANNYGITTEQVANIIFGWTKYAMTGKVQK